MNYICPNDLCKAELLDLKQIGTLHDKPEVNDILLCGNCGEMASVTTEGCRPLGQVEFLLLSKDEQRDLDIASRAIKANMIRQVRNN